MKETTAQNVAEMQEHMVAHRRTLHQIPGVGPGLPQTTSYIRKILTELDCIPQSIRTCDQVVTLGQGGRTLLLRAGMNALQAEEHNDLPFCAANGYIHAYGHDIYTTILSRAAGVLKRYKQKLPCRAKLVLQPGEELGTGAQSLVEAGLLENPHVDAVAALHVDSTVAVGECFYCTGVTTSDVYDIFIQLKGKGRRSPQPEEAINTLTTTNGVFRVLSGLVQREVGGFDTATLVICSMHAGSQ